MSFRKDAAAVIEIDGVGPRDITTVNGSTTDDPGVQRLFDRACQRRIHHTILHSSEQCPDAVEGVGLSRGLVRAVAHDAGEAQGDAAGIAAASLCPVDGDLHDELGA